MPKVGISGKGANVSVSTMDVPLTQKQQRKLAKVMGQVFAAYRSQRTSDVAPLRTARAVPGGILERYTMDRAVPCECNKCSAERTADAFKEEDHPRGQPGNAGEFAEAAGSGKHLSMARALVPAAPDRSDLPPHIQALKLPPAWTKIHYHPDPNADLLAIGQDAADRSQYVYSSSYTAKQAAAKFARVRELESRFSALQKKNEANTQSHLPAVKDAADLVKLIMETGIRPGSNSDTKAKVKAYGATTLLGRHVHTTASGTSLQFTGKKGVALNIPVKDKAIAAILQERANQAGRVGKLFPYATDSKLRGYVKQLSHGDFKPKDFRTYVANSTALSAMSSLPKPNTETAFKKQVKEVATRVAKKLGNTPTVALNSYINPDVFSIWRAGVASAAA